MGEGARGGGGPAGEGAPAAGVVTNGGGSGPRTRWQLGRIGHGRK
jgi:hypothetical protein